MKYSFFSHSIIKWYEANKRELPWRQTNDPYKIWLSEIILQQTKVSQGLPYYLNFVKNFPKVKDLAATTEEKVLRLWQGLGYYSRARNLYKCAKTVSEEYGGCFPDQYDQLLKLPGIGKYTAAAIASLAFNEKVPVVDGNVYRVLARVFGIKTDIASSKAFKEFFDLGKSLLLEDNPGQFNQAMMEFGACYCKPIGADCQHCIFKDKCIAFKESTQQYLPVKTNKIKPRNRYFNYIVLTDGEKYALKPRGIGDIWQGLFDPHLIETIKSEEINDLENELLKGCATNGAQLLFESEEIKHVLTHQRIYAKFYILQLPQNKEMKTLLIENKLVLYSREEIEALPKPVLVNNFLNKHLISIPE